MTSNSFNKTLVTGGAGFIGSHLVESLLERGTEVVVLDNLSTGKKENLQALGGGQWTAGKDFEFVQGDIRDLETVKQAMSGVGMVLHQAALGSVPRSVDDPITTQQVNADGTLNVFLAARDSDVSRVIYASSSAIYGDSETLPRTEGSEGRTLSPYALTKKINEEHGRLFTELYKLETIGLRYFNVYGPRQDPKSEYAAVIPRFVSALLSERTPVIHGTGEQSRDFTFVKDIVQANLLGLEAESSACGTAYNVGRGGQYNLLQLLKILQDLLGSESEPVHEAPRPGDVMHSWADTSLVEKTLGFVSQYDLNEGLSRSVEWYKRYLG